MKGNMIGVYLTGHGGLDKLEYREDIPIPKIDSDEVLIQVLAASVNNTDINTRIGWYSKSVTHSTQEAQEAVEAESNHFQDGSWSGGAIHFPRIQGADCVGIIREVGEDVSIRKVGEQVMVRTLLRGYSNDNLTECWTLGSECDGAFAQFTKVKAINAYRINSDWSHAELASIPCAYSTAEGMLTRSQVNDKDTVFITGASGGVGSAAVQLTKARGARVIALVGTGKELTVKQLGADEVVSRDTFKGKLKETVDVVIDLVGGEQWTHLLDLLKAGGRYATAGAIAGPMVDLDLRTLYLKDLTLYGCTFQTDGVFENVIHCVEKNLIKPVIAKTYPLSDIVQAQRDFLAKKFTGKLVLIPPHFS